jgi:hypothetical protein
MPASSLPAASSICRHCRHFVNAAALVEEALPGLSSLSSAYAAVRDEDGICHIHDRYVAAGSHCAQFKAGVFTMPPPQRGSRRTSDHVQDR